MADERVIPITVGDEFKRPDDKPVFGNKRLVRLLPTPLGSREAIWTSPYFVTEEIDGKPTKCRKVIVLLDKGPPAPSIAVLTIPEGAVDRFPLVPVEW